MSVQRPLMMLCMELIGITSDVVSAIRRQREDLQPSCVRNVARVRLMEWHSKWFQYTFTALSICCEIMSYVLQVPI